MADMKNDIAGWAEAMSRLFPTKDEMDAVLKTAERLHLDENPHSEFAKELRHARHLLEGSPDVPTFLSALRNYAAGATTSPVEVFADASPAEVFAEIQTTETRRTMAGFTFIIAALVAGIGGYLHWPLWIAVAAGLVAFIVRDASQNFRVSINMGAGVFIRSTIMSVLMMVVIWGVGYGISKIAGG